MKNQYRGGDFLKRGSWTVCQFKGCLARKRGVFFFGGGEGGVDTPMHTMILEQNQTRWVEDILFWTLVTPSPSPPSQSVPQTHFKTNFQKGNIFPGKESMFLFWKIQPCRKMQNFYAYHHSVWCIKKCFY